MSSNKSTRSRRNGRQRNNNNNSQNRSGGSGNRGGRSSSGKQGRNHQGGNHNSSNNKNNNNKNNNNKNSKNSKNNNNVRTSFQSPATQSSNETKKADVQKQQMHAKRFLHALTNMIGSSVTAMVDVSDQQNSKMLSKLEEYEGIFDLRDGTTSKTHPVNFSVVLATKVVKNDHESSDINVPSHVQPVIDELLLQAGKVTELYAPGVNLISSDTSATTAIPVAERELQSANDWLAKGGDPKSGELKRKNDTGKWDQFKANEHLTNGKSMQYREEDFTEEYTTKLVRL